MDRKSLITLVICGGLFVLWTYLTPKFYPPGANSTNSVSTAIGSNATRTATAPATNGGTMAAATAPALSALPPGLTTAAASNAPEQKIVLTNNLLRLTFTSRGGGISRAELLQHRESVTCSSRKLGGSNQPVTLNGPALLPILAQAGGELGDGTYRLSPLTQRIPTTNSVGSAKTNSGFQGIRAEKLLTNGVYIVKDFELDDDDYTIRARVRFENRSTGELILPPQSWMVGTATPISPQDNEQSVGLMWFDGSRANQVNDAYFQNKTLGCVPGTPKSEYSASSTSVQWAAAKNQFFFIAVMPEVPGTAITANKFILPPPPLDVIASDAKTLTNQYAFNVVLTQAGTNIAPGAAFERNFRIYTGPKEYRRLERLADDMKNEIDRLMEFGFFGIFARGLLLAMNWLNSIGFSYALAIITITVIIKLIFWPLTQASTRSMKRMQALQPQMKALQEKYKDDPAKMNKKLMEFMKENKVSPLGGCLPLMLQIPVFISFFQMVKTAIELRGASFLWACDLSRPDTIFVIPGVNFNVNPLPVLMGITMFWQAQLTPPAPGMDPVQQKLMKYFPLVFLFILYDYSAGLTLYWTVQNILSITQTKLTRISEGKKATGNSGGAGAGGTKAPAYRRPKS